MLFSLPQLVSGMARSPENHTPGHSKVNLFSVLILIFAQSLCHYTTYAGVVLLIGAISVAGCFWQRRHDSRRLELGRDRVPRVERGVVQARRTAFSYLVPLARSTATR